ncbi:hypothetical protein E4T49_02372 [Aureobasidium sp. EXF-10728]|nr:hypothetical protein E4T49_02372 [Aureobasidium sp. EXF-10728]
MLPIWVRFLRDYGMSDNDTDGESVHDDDNEVNNAQEDSGSDYQDEDDHSDDANSVRSARSQTSNRSVRSGSGKKSITTAKLQPRMTKSIKATYKETYRDFYNDQLEELIRPFHSITHALPASEIGVAVWTPLEKEVLFQKISTVGKDNIKDISSAIRTKSETEVRQYISLLDAGTVEGNVTKALPVFSAADIPPAFEVSKQSEELLEEYADGLAKYQLRGDQKREKKRHGDYWLLTEDIAQEVEEQVMARDESYAKSSLHEEDADEDEEETFDNAKSDHEAANTDIETDREDLKTDAEDEPDVHEQATSQSQEPDQQAFESPEEVMVPAAELLDLPMWLKLSQMFMYQSPELGDSWNNFTTSRHETPSMYHTAFQDFHNLTVSLTRRVVQATIFQTMTRLRARDKDSPSARVTAGDVRAAIDVLDLQPNTRKFWGDVPRKHGLRVYERGSKFSRGQSRAGVELSLEEAEQRLGIGHTSTVVAETDDDVVQTVEDGMEDDVLDPDHYYDDPELWTEASDTEDEAPVNIPDDQHSGGSDDEDAAYHPTDDEEVQDAARKKSHRKGRMEKNFQKAHDAYLEAVDQEISRVQEIEMWDALGIAPPNDIKDEEVEIPRQPVIHRRLSDNADWRDGFEYKSSWELGFNTIQPEAFASMHKRGQQARKRRRLAYEHLEQGGLVVLPQQASEIAVVRKSTKPTDTDTEMVDAPAEEAPFTTAETFKDGVPRKKRPKPVLNRILSIETTNEPLLSRSAPHDRSRGKSWLSQALLTQDTKEDGRRARRKQKKEQTLAEESRVADEQFKEAVRNARAGYKGTLSKEERQALEQQEQEERDREAEEARRLANEERQRKQRIKDEEQKEKQRLAQEEQQRTKEAMQTAKEERQRAREEKRRAKEEEQRTKAGKRKADNEEPIDQEPDAEQPEDTTRSTRSRSKKPKRKSGF